MSIFEEKTFEAIREELLALLPDSAGARIEGSYTSNIIAAVALELAKAYAYINTLESAMFPTADSGEYLRRRAADFGLTPKPATAASGTISVSGTAGTVIPAGARLIANDTGIAFATLESITLSGSRASAIGVRAAQTGEILVRANTLRFDPAISGITSVLNSEIRGGTNVESDAELYYRLKLRLQSPPASGTAADYKRWALEVPGIGFAKVRKLESGESAGVILVTVTDPEMRRPSSDVFRAALENINAKRPLGAEVSVRWPIESSGQISATVRLEKGATIASVQERFESSLREHLKSIIFDESVDAITLARVTHILMSTPGVEDVQQILLNGRAENWVYSEVTIPTIGSISITEAS